MTKNRISAKRARETDEKAIEIATESSYYYNSKTTRTMKILLTREDLRSEFVVKYFTRRATVLNENPENIESYLRKMYGCAFIDMARVYQSRAKQIKDKGHTFTHENYPVFAPSDGSFDGEWENV